MSVATEPAISTLHPAAQRRTDALEKANIFCEGLVTYLWPWAGGQKYGFGNGPFDWKLMADYGILWGMFWTLLYSKILITQRLVTTDQMPSRSGAPGQSCHPPTPCPNALAVPTSDVAARIGSPIRRRDSEGWYGDAHCPSVVRVIATTCGSKTMGQWMSTITCIIIYATDLSPIQLLQEHLLPAPPSHIRASTFAADAVLIARPSEEFRARLLGCQASFKPHQ